MLIRLPGLQVSMYTFIGNGSISIGFCGHLHIIEIAFCFLLYVHTKIKLYNYTALYSKKVIMKSHHYMFVASTTVCGVYTVQVEIYTPFDAIK